MRKLYLILLFTLFLPQLTASQSPSIILERYYENLTSFEATFSITEFESVLVDQQSRSGTIRYLKSDTGLLFRVDFEKTGDSIVVNGVNFSLCNKRLKSCTVGSLSNSTYRGLPDLLKTPKAEILNNYKIVYMGVAKVDETDVWHLRMTPKSESSWDINEIDTWLDGNGAPRRLLFKFDRNETTDMLISNVRKNTPMDESIFKIDLKNKNQPK